MIENEQDTPDWWIFTGCAQPHNGLERLPAAPPWRCLDKAQQASQQVQQFGREEIELVNAALYLRRPVLLTGKPGTGKTSLAYTVAHELQMGDVLRWSITSKSNLNEGLYQYDALARLQDASLAKQNQQQSPAIEDYLSLGPLGSAFADPGKQRLLLIDEIDKSDIDLPNDLLHIFEEGSFNIPELTRLKDEQVRTVFGCDSQRTPFEIKHGWVNCHHFPLVIMTSNGEREFPPAFMRRCLHLQLQQPDKSRLVSIAHSHLKHQEGFSSHQAEELVDAFLNRREQIELSTDQLLNAIYLSLNQIHPDWRTQNKQALVDAIWHKLA